MSRYDKIPEGYTEEEVENELPFLGNAKIKNAKIKTNDNNKLYWNYGKFYNGIFKSFYWEFGDFYNGKFINSYWDSGDFHNGTFTNSYWDWGIFFNGKFINSYWRNGYIFNGFFINSIIKKIDENNKFEDYSKVRFHNCIILEPRLLKLNRTYSKLTFKGIK